MKPYSSHAEIAGLAEEEGKGPTGSKPEGWPLSFALEALHKLSQGLLRRINRLADLALLVGFADELPLLQATQIEAAVQELSLTS